MKKVKQFNAMSIIVLQIILTAISSVIPYGYKLILDNYIKTGIVADYKIIFLIICIGILSYIMNIFLVSYLQEKLIVSQGTEYQKEAFYKIIKMPQHGYEELGSSFLMNSIIVDAEQTSRYDFIKNIQIYGYMVNAAILFVVLILINRILAIISILSIFIYFSLLNLRGRSLQEKNNSLMNCQDDVLNIIKQYVMNNTAIVKSENIPFFEDRFIETFKRWIKDKQDLVLAQSTIQKIPVTVSLSLPLIILYIGTSFVRTGNMTLGSLMMFIQILNLMYVPVNKFSDSMADLKVLKANKERFHKIFTTFSQQDILSNEINGILIKDTEIKTPDGKVLYKGSLSTGEKGLYIIKGANGTGKSTLLRAIIGNLSPKQINGQVYVSTDLLKNVSFLKYPLFLFQDSVLQNIKGAPNLQKDIDIHEVLKFNPPSLDKEIKLDPLNLSSGEAQKVVLLREILKESKMVLLDEPTTNLDNKAIYELENYIGKEKNNKLFLLIMHDDSLDNMADGFIFIEDKKLWMENVNV